MSEVWSQRLAAFARAATALSRQEVGASALALLQVRVPYELATLHLDKREHLVLRAQRGPWAVPGHLRHAVAIADVTGLPALLAAPAGLGGSAAVALAARLLPPGDLPAARQVVLVPVSTAQRAIGVLALQRLGASFSNEELAAAGELAGVLALAVHAARLGRRLEQAQQQLAEREPARDLPGTPPGPLLDRSRSPAMRNAVLLARQVAASDAPVLLTGETGSGKEVLARAMHAWSARADGPFVAVNCAALPEAVVESELFGHAAGAFSGALAARAGRFAIADGGTLLLDEVGELPPAAQALLLRVLQEGCFEAVGSDETQEVDVRIIAASNRDLDAEVAAGRFRQDLFYRLAVFPVHVPPLRERRQDIAVIAAEWLAARARSGGGPWSLSPAAASRLEGHEWPGNVRELLNCLERATILQPRGELAAERFPLRQRLAPAIAGRTLAEHEAELIRQTLARCDGRLYGPGGAAARLGLKPTTLQSRMKRLGVQRRPG